MSQIPDTRVTLIVRLPDHEDQVAWDEFAKIYGPALFAIARSRGIQAADAEDLVQEVLASVSRSIEDWLQRDDRGSFKAWLLSIARNRAVNFLTRSRPKSLGTGQSDIQKSLLQVPDKVLESEFDIEYRRAVFRRAAERLKERVSVKGWQSFWLTAVDRKDIKEVARQLNVTVGSVYVNRSRIMKQLRDIVSELEDPES